MTADSQAERELSMSGARQELWAALYGRDAAALPKAAGGPDVFAAVEHIEDAARAAGRGEAAERIEALERDLATAEHNQDVLAQPFDAGGQMDQAQARVEKLEGMVKETADALAGIAVQYGQLGTINFDPGLASEARSLAVKARALLSEGAE